MPDTCTHTPLAQHCYQEVRLASALCVSGGGERWCGPLSEHLQPHNSPPFLCFRPLLSMPVFLGGSQGKSSRSEGFAIVMGSSQLGDRLLPWTWKEGFDLSRGGKHILEAFVFLALISRFCGKTGPAL